MSDSTFSDLSLCSMTVLSVTSSLSWPGPIPGSHMHLAVEYFVSGLSGFFCAIHRRVGVAQKILGLACDIAGDNNTDTGCGEDLVIIDLRGFRYLCLKTFSHTDDLGQVACSIEKYSEFVTAETGNNITRTYAGS